VRTKDRMTLVWSSSLDSWEELKLELQLEAETIFASSGGVVLVMPNSDTVLTLVSGTRSLKLTLYPDRNAVRWDSPEEYGFEKIPEDTISLARTLMQRLCRWP
jgi:hypothetical protein